MRERLFYVDSSIWFNLFKKEGNPFKGTPYWKIAEEFIKSVMFSDNKKIIYTGFILKEIKFKTNNEEIYKYRLKFLSNEEKFIFVKATPEDYNLARKFESEFNYKISFFDCMHIAICKRTESMLITRDALLIKFAKKYIKAYKPENIL